VRRGGMTVALNIAPCEWSVWSKSAWRSALREFCAGRFPVRSCKGWPCHALSFAREAGVPHFRCETDELCALRIWKAPAVTEQARHDDEQNSGSLRT
jgi:hypothetical protein